MRRVDYSVIPWEWLPLSCKWFWLWQLQTLRKCRWSFFSLPLSLELLANVQLTWTNFVSRKGWPKNFKAPQVRQVIAMSTLDIVSSSLGWILLMAVVSYDFLLSKVWYYIFGNHEILLGYAYIKQIFTTAGN